MSLLEEYFKLYTNKAVIAMIMILLGVAIILYIIKRINEALDPSAQEENGKIKDDKIDAPIKIQNWSEKDFKKFQRRDLIDHYGFSYYGGTNVYTPFAGIHLMQTTNLPALSHHIVDKKIKTDEPFRHSLDIYLTLLCTEFNEPFYLDYKWKPRAAEKEEAAAEEEQQSTAT